MKRYQVKVNGEVVYTTDHLLLAKIMRDDKAGVLVDTARFVGMDDLMFGCTHEALINGQPFSCIDTRRVRYWGSDKAVLQMQHE